MARLKVDLTVVEGPEKDKSFSFYEPENFLLGRNGFRQHRNLRRLSRFIRNENSS